MDNLEENQKDICDLESQMHRAEKNNFRLPSKVNTFEICSTSPWYYYISSSNVFQNV